MFEHLDDVLQPANPLDDPEYAGIRDRTIRAQRRRTALATTVTVSVLATGGAAGLALNGMDIRRAVPGGSPILAIGAPQDFSPSAFGDLTSSETTPPNECPRVLTPASTTTGTSRSTPVTVLGPTAGTRTPTPSPSIAAIQGGASAASSGKVVVLGGGGAVSVVPAHPSGGSGGSTG